MNVRKVIFLILCLSQCLSRAENDENLLKRQNHVEGEKLSKIITIFHKDEKIVFNISDSVEYNIEIVSLGQNFSLFQIKEPTSKYFDVDKYGKLGSGSLRNFYVLAKFNSHSSDKTVSFYDFVMLIEKADSIYNK